MAPTKPVGIALCLVLVSPALITGCLSQDFSDVMVPGTGYRSIRLHNQTDALVFVDFEPATKTVALLYRQGLIELWSANGTFITSWHVVSQQGMHSCGYSWDCVMRFLPNGSLLIAASNSVFGYSQNGESHQVLGADMSRNCIRHMVPLDNGSRLLLGYCDSSAQIVNLVTGVNETILDRHDGTTYRLTSSSDGRILGTTSARTAATSVTIWRHSGENLHSYARNADVQMTADGRFAVVGARGRNPGDGPVLLSLESPASPPVVFSVSDLSFGVTIGPGTAPAPVAISPGGRLIAVKAGVTIENCGRLDCVVGEASYVRILDPSAPNRNLGFGDWPFRIFLEDDGSAIAISAFGNTTTSTSVDLILADPGATPPHRERISR